MTLNEYFNFPPAIYHSRIRKLGFTSIYFIFHRYKGALPCRRLPSLVIMYFLRILLCLLQFYIRAFLFRFAQLFGL